MAEFLQTPGNDKNAYSSIAEGLLSEFQIVSKGFKDPDEAFETIIQNLDIALNIDIRNFRAKDITTSKLGIDLEIHNFKFNGKRMLKTAVHQLNALTTNLHVPIEQSAFPHSITYVASNFRDITRLTEEQKIALEKIFLEVLKRRYVFKATFENRHLNTYNRGNHNLYDILNQNDEI